MRTPATATTTARPGWRRPVVQFVAVGLVLALALAAVTGWFSQRAAREEAVADAQSTAELLARTVIQPALSAGMVGDDAAGVDRFDRLVRSRVTDSQVVRVKLWDADGTIVYSDEPRLVGETFELEEDQLAVLTEGGTDAEVSDLARSENEYDRALGQVLEVYTRVTGPNDEPVLFELYVSYDEVANRTDQVLGAFLPISVGGILLFLALTVPLVWLLARRLDDAAGDRERLLLAAASASDGERRRIARDLHDTVVQDLAGTSFSLSATAREVADSDPVDRKRLADGLVELASGLRRNLRSLRSLLVEIYPPDLSGARLPSALDDLLAPAAAGGVEVTLDVGDTTGLPDGVVALVWRTAQECVRNALRHGRPDALLVRVSQEVGGTPGTPALVRLEVTDDGAGFEPPAGSAGDHFGLRGLRDLAAEAGGTLRVVSAPGSGTTVVLEVPVR